jgi:hypothetical protein
LGLYREMNYLELVAANHLDYCRIVCELLNSDIHWKNVALQIKSRFEWLVGTTNKKVTEEWGNFISRAVKN